MILEDVGFREDEIFSLVVHRGRPYVPAVVNGEFVLLQLRANIDWQSGEEGWDVAVYEWFAATRRLQRRAGGAQDAEEDVVELDSFSLFGAVELPVVAHLSKWQPFPHALTTPEGREVRIAGAVGFDFFSEGRLALDVGRQALAYSKRSEVPGPTVTPDHSLTILNSALPVVDDVRISDLYVGDQSAEQHFLIDVARAEGYVTLALLDQLDSPRLFKWVCGLAKRLKRTFTCKFQVGSETVKTRIGVKDGIEDVRGGTRIPLGGVLGTDFLKHWLPVFDFPDETLTLLSRG